MKALKIKIPDRLYTLETGPEAQVGDQVKMFLDMDAIPGLPEFLFGVIQHPIKRVGACGEQTLYTIEYELSDYTLRDDDVLGIVTTSAVDVVANDLLIETNNRIAADTAEAATRAAADVVLQNNIDAEESARVAADATLQANITAEANERIAADANLQINITEEEAARIAADALKQNSLLNIGAIPTGTGAGASLGTNAADKVGLHGASVVQRAGAAQIAVPTTSLTISNPPTQAEVQAVVARQVLIQTLINELRAAVVEKGIIKGSA